MINSNLGPISHRLATIPHDWHCTVCYDLSRSSKVNGLYLIWKPACNSYYWSIAT